MRLKIGEFARLGQISVQTLRYYDDLGLLKPSEVDHFSNYRYYALDQLPSLLRILALKDLGISLDQIRLLMSENMSDIELRRILTVKRDDLQKQVADGLDQMERIEARLQSLDRTEASPHCEVIIKQISPMRVASVRGKIASFWDVTPLWHELQSHLQPYRLTLEQPSLTICHASEPEIDVEVCIPVPKSPPAGLAVNTLPGYDCMACTIHRGGFSGLAPAFTSLIRWVDENRYTIVGPDREIYLRLPEKGKYQSDSEAITELQIPVQKTA